MATGPQMDLSTTKQQVMSLAREGRFAEANNLCTGLCKRYGNDAEAWFLLAAINGQLGRFAEAEEYCGNAVRLAPGHPAAHYNLAVARYRQGKSAAAEQAFNRALELKPDFAEAHHDLASLLLETGRQQQAVRHYRDAIRVNPSFARAWYNLGRALEPADREGEAIECYRQATRLAPNFADAWFRLGNSLSAAGNHEHAVDAFRSAIAADRNHADACNNLGNSLRELGRAEEAVEALQQAVALKGEFPEGMYNLALALQSCGRLQEAEAAYKDGLAGRPLPQAANNLGNLLVTQGRIDEAEHYYRQAMAADPRYVEAHSNLLFCLNYKTGADLDAIYREHREWERLHAMDGPASGFSNTPDPDRPIVIGYLSPDFCEHSVAYFIEALLSGHDRKNFRVVCYADVRKPDATTRRLEQLADNWRLTADTADDALATQIRQDGVDILIDLAGHTKGNRLVMLSGRPAPVQFSFLGYPNTTGLAAVDYRITDALADPDDSQEQYAETLLRIPGCFLCYTPPQFPDTPAVSPAPVVAGGHITFGSFNNLAKLNDAVLELWSDILKAVPDSRLMLKNRSLEDRDLRRNYLDRFARHGIDANRLQLITLTPSTRDHLLMYNRVDIGLDTFPYNGATTTCEALWMGVPVITLSGDRHAGRVGHSLLANAGLPDLVAMTTDDYRDIATGLAGDIDRLSGMRAGLRERLLASTLCNRDSYCSRVEAAYRKAWVDWCRAS